MVKEAFPNPSAPVLREGAGVGDKGVSVTFLVAMTKQLT